VRREALVCVMLICTLTAASGQVVANIGKSETGALAESRDRAGGQAPIDDLRTKRAQAEAELQAVSLPETLAAGAPSGTPQGELVERRTLLHLIVRNADEQIDDTQRLEQTRQRRAEFNKAQAESNNQTESPPYSIFFADQLWDTTYSLRLAVEGLQSQLSLIELRFNRARESLQGAEERLRQASERAEAAKGTPADNRQRWLRDLEALRQRVAAAMLQAPNSQKSAFRKS
jgi:potassium efflux system protein